MAKSLKIDFVSDVSCPWCMIGLGGLESALDKLAGEVAADLHFQPFELNPDMAPGGENIREHLDRKYRTTPEQSTQAREMIRARAGEAGFIYGQNDDSRIYNTFDAHRLLHWAEGSGKQAALKRALFEAYFTDQKSPADHDVLVGAAAKAGLDEAQARDVLASGRYADEVRRAEQHWRQAGITSVPAVIVNDKYLISGGQPAQVFESALRQIAAES